MFIAILAIIGLTSTTSDIVNNYNTSILLTNLSDGYIPYWNGANNSFEDSPISYDPLAGVSINDSVNIYSYGVLEAGFIETDSIFSTSRAAFWYSEDMDSMVRVENDYLSGSVSSVGYQAGWYIWDQVESGLYSYKGASEKADLYLDTKSVYVDINSSNKLKINSSTTAIKNNLDMNNNYINNSIINITYTDNSNGSQHGYIDASSGNKTNIAGTWAFAADGGQTLRSLNLTSSAGYIDNSASHNNGDAVGFGNYTLPGGNYTVTLYTLRHTVNGIHEAWLGSTKIGTWDNYGSLMYNYNRTNDIVVTTPLSGRLELRINGHNTSSSSYYGYISGLKVEGYTSGNLQIKTKSIQYILQKYCENNPVSCE